MKFSILAAVFATVSSAASIPRGELPAGQQPLPAKFKLTFTSDYKYFNIPSMLHEIRYDPTYPYRAFAIDTISEEDEFLGGVPVPITLSADGDRVFLIEDGSEYQFGMDIAGWAAIDKDDREVLFQLPYQPGAFAQVDGLFAYNAGDGHGPPTTQWKLCEMTGRWYLIWNRPECESITVQVVPVDV